MNGWDADGRFIIAALTIIAIATAVYTGYKIYKATKNGCAKADKLNKKVIEQANNDDINSANTSYESKINQYETGDKLVTEARKLPGIVSTDPVKGLLDGTSFVKNNVKLKGPKRKAKITSKQGPSGTYGKLNSKGNPKTIFVKGGHPTSKGNITKSYFRVKPKK